QGEAGTGRELVRIASAKLQEGARRCESVRRCDVGRFIATYDTLLQEGLAAATGGGEGYAAATADHAESGVLAHMPAAGRSVAQLKGRDLRELIELNEPVRAALAEWLT